MLDVRNWLKVVETGTRKQKISVQKKKQLIKEYNSRRTLD